ncbi:unnamed protein product [Cuscuta campestris]|uniref:C2H2-type domain-containing protein n=1 Tax=Cuscuta campestris TaxID=132261 RepID=A0A484KZ49_9ASTE|nr:unnamed protein product [Cuscuta campestris]
MDCLPDLPATAPPMGLQRRNGNPLDLNHLPAADGDHSSIIVDGKQHPSEDTSSCAAGAVGGGGGYGKKKGGDESGNKVYECRFCSLKFCKSQALGGHMNRHRQERETETLNRARQLVFSTDTNLLAQGPHHLPIMGYQALNMGDPNIHYRSIYPPRLFPGQPAGATIIPPLPTGQPHTYAPPPHYPANDYLVGRILPTTQSPAMANLENSYTCIGAPVGQGLLPGGRGGPEVGPASGRNDMPPYNADPLTNRYQDGF